MSATELLAELTRLGIQLVAHGDRLRYRPRSRVSAELAGRLLAYKSELLAILSHEAEATTPAPVADEADPYVGWIERAGPDGCVSLTHPDHTTDVYIDPPDPCPDCDSLESWWSPRGDRFCMKCDPPTTALRLRELATRLKNRRTGRPTVAPKACP